MPRVCFTPNLHKLVDVHEYEVAGSTIAQALEDVFSRQPTLQSYIVDDQKRLRRHINVFVDGELIRGAHPLNTEIRPESEIYIMQALSGG
ncbi:ThiS family protein [Polystyrenella longa]|uniref:ThiS family protein n=2 Tax=Polystyrenella longa TaxID=2528007 RepID=A0A518CL10_9PLAN|nr:ThiS family protein [Polystyrenella longa]